MPGPEPLHPDAAAKLDIAILNMEDVMHTYTAQFAKWKSLLLTAGDALDRAPKISPSPNQLAAQKNLVAVVANLVAAGQFLTGSIDGAKQWRYGGR